MKNGLSLATKRSITARLISLALFISFLLPWLVFLTRYGYHLDPLKQASIWFLAGLFLSSITKRFYKRNFVARVWCSVAFSAAAIVVVLGNLAIGAIRAGDVKPEDRFVMESFYDDAETKAAAEHMLASCNHDLDCVDAIIRRDNPDVVVDDHGRTWLIERGYHVHRRTWLIVDYTYSFSLQAKASDRKVNHYFIRQNGRWD